MRLPYSCKNVLFFAHNEILGKPNHVSPEKKRKLTLLSRFRFNKNKQKQPLKEIPSANQSFLTNDR